jgi:uncharacterized membrane protein YphA (DoxX/SURF4 family)
MLVAIASATVPIVAGRCYGGFADASDDRRGLWSMLHEARTDLSMLLGSAFIVAVGAGAWSVDALQSTNARPRRRKNHP